MAARRIRGESGGPGATGEATDRRQVVQEGHLPVNEFLFDRPGGASPFGEDITFPLPVDRLMYSHPERQPLRER